MECSIEKETLPSPSSFYYFIREGARRRAHSTWVLISPVAAPWLWWWWCEASFLLFVCRHYHPEHAGGMPEGLDDGCMMPGCGCLQSAGAIGAPGRALFAEANKECFHAPAESTHKTHPMCILTLVTRPIFTQAGLTEVTYLSNYVLDSFQQPCREQSRHWPHLPRN